MCKFITSREFIFVVIGLVAIAGSSMGSGWREHSGLLMVIGITAHTISWWLLGVRAGVRMSKEADHV
jgi:hypothetical protein